jgi:hypothetical protein
MEDTNKSKPEAAFKAAFAPTDPVDPRAVVVVTVGDVQQVAQQTINRDLSGIELMQVQAIIKAGLGNRTETIQDAICKVLDVRRVPDTEQRPIRTMHDMSVRKEALTKFYKQVISRFEGDLLERLLFIQCFAALDASEGHCLAWLYTEDFNTALIQYQREKEHGEI